MSRRVMKNNNRRGMLPDLEDPVPKQVTVHRKFRKSFSQSEALSEAGDINNREDVPTKSEVREHGSLCLGDPSRVTPYVGVVPVVEEEEVVEWELLCPDDDWGPDLLKGKGFSGV